MKQPSKQSILILAGALLISVPPATVAGEPTPFTGQGLFNKAGDLTSEDLPPEFFNSVKDLKGSEPNFIERWTASGSTSLEGDFTSELLVMGYLVFSPQFQVIGVETWDLETMTMASGDQLLFRNELTLQIDPPNPSTITVSKTITGGTGKYENAEGSATGEGFEDDTGASLTFEGTITLPPPSEPVVLRVPEDSPGSPWYADFGRDFIPADEAHAAIVFWRDLACIPADFNLLDMLDIPAAFGCPISLRGQEWWHEPFVDYPFKMALVNDGPVPVYFVTLEELAAETADDRLTLGELSAFQSLRKGQARHLQIEVLNSNAPDSDGKGHGLVTGTGDIEGDQSFYLHWSEEFDPAVGRNEFLEVVIRFFPKLEIGRAVRLTWSSDEPGLEVESAPSVTGPWEKADAVVRSAAGQFEAFVAAGDSARFFRLADGE